MLQKSTSLFQTKKGICWADLNVIDVILFRGFTSLPQFSLYCWTDSAGDQFHRVSWASFTYRKCVIGRLVCRVDTGAKSLCTVRYLQLDLQTPKSSHCHRNKERYHRCEIKWENQSWGCAWRWNKNCFSLCSTVALKLVFSSHILNQRRISAVHRQTWRTCQSNYQ